MGGVDGLGDEVRLLVDVEYAVEEADRRVGEGERDPPVNEHVFRDRARPPLVEMIAFVDKMRGRFGVELVCRVLRQAEVGFLTARGYRATKARSASARQQRDELSLEALLNATSSTVEFDLDLSRKTIVLTLR